jgi:hypothetical protein
VSNSTNTDPRASTNDDREAVGVEPWLIVSFLALIPLALAFYLPTEWRPYLFVAGGLLGLVGGVMLVRQERRKSSDVRA